MKNHKDYCLMTALKAQWFPQIICQSKNRSSFKWQNLQKMKGFWDCLQPKQTNKQLTRISHLMVWVLVMQRRMMVKRMCQTNIRICIGVTMYSRVSIFTWKINKTWNSDSNSYQIKEMYMHKGVSDVETCTNYFAVPGTSCESLNFSASVILPI